MAQSSSSSSSSGIGVCGLLGVAFVVLKLTHVINWSWWWITAPFWGGFAIVFGILILGFLGIATAAAVTSIADRKRRLTR